MRAERDRNVGAGTIAAALLALGLPTYNGRLRGRGRVIAADQLETLAGLIAQHQQKDAGLDRFVWQTREDDRVRAQHRAWNKREFTWEDGAPGGVFPGQPIRCRCRARGVVP
jgi:SPP1 gp7 family putative phage head morphogenesis protein